MFGRDGLSAVAWKARFASNASKLVFIFTISVSSTAQVADVHGPGFKDRAQFNYRRKQAGVFVVFARLCTPDMREKTSPPTGTTKRIACSSSFRYTMAKRSRVTL